jgi:hypothetical protein
LFQAIGTDWGPGDYNTTFNLPPAAKFYISDSGFLPNSEVPLDSGSPTSGWGVRGGSQLAALLTYPQVPDLKLRVSYSTLEKITRVGGSPISALQPPGTGQLSLQEVRDSNGAIMQSQIPTTQIPLMPPFAAANFIIKYQ